MKPISVVLSCEHAVNTIPTAYQTLFEENAAILTTHRGIDIGAQTVATQLQQHFACDYHQATVSRLLIDCNRSLRHPGCFSEWTQPLSSKEKKHIVATYYQPYRTQVAQTIQRHIHQGEQVLHLSIHSFTPVLDDITRNAAIGLLYDTKRPGEKEVAREWFSLLSQEPPYYRVRYNYPYKGNSDGLTCYLRRFHPQQDYLGLEIECNQALMITPESQQLLIQVLIKTLEDLLQLLN